MSGSEITGTELSVIDMSGTDIVTGTHDSASSGDVF